MLVSNERDWPGLTEWIGGLRAGIFVKESAEFPVSSAQVVQQLSLPEHEQAAETEFEWNSC